jgi:PIN domain nuclease of toxin-antitoxin system
VRVLLDTHVFLWLLTQPERLAEHLRLLEDRRNALLVSAVRSWEIAIKHALGRLALPEPPARYVPERLRAIGAEALAIEHTHALASLPPLHGDPFDRLLVAQASLLAVPIITADPAVAQYPIEALLVN